MRQEVAVRGVGVVRGKVTRAQDNDLRGRLLRRSGVEYCLAPSGWLSEVQDWSKKSEDCEG